MVLAAIWEAIKGTGVWMWGHKNIAGYIILALVIAFLTWRNNNLTHKNTQLTIERGQLPDNIEFIADLKGNNFKVTYRDSKNNVIVKEYYVPREGGVKFTKYIDLKQYDAKAGFNGNSINPPNASIPSTIIDKFLNPFKPHGSDDSPVKVDWYGFTFGPGISAMYDGNLNGRAANVGLDFKLIYINRYSMGLGSTVEYPYVWGSRHIDDLVPFIKVENLELMGGYGRTYSDFGHGVFVIGGRTSF